MSKPTPTLSGKTWDAFALQKIEGGWTFITVTLDGSNKVVNVTRTQPDMKPIAQEAFKIAAAKSWSRQEL